MTQTPRPDRQYIIFTDDDSDDRFFFNEAFSEIKMNLDLLMFASGINMLEFLSRAKVILPQLIFLDLNMPGKNGIECLSELKQTEYLKDIPVVIYSTSDSQKDIDICLHLKAHMYIRKPSELPHIKSIIQKVLVTDFASKLSLPAKEKYLIFSE